MPKGDEEDEEKNEYNDLSQYKVVVNKKLQYIDEVCENIRGSAGFSRFQFVKYDKLSKVDKEKVEKAVVDMMENFKYTPLELGNITPDELYDHFWS